jgi:hypothetical protein
MAVETIILILLLQLDILIFHYVILILFSYYVIHDINLAYMIAVIPSLSLESIEAL